MKKIKSVNVIINDMISLHHYKPLKNFILYKEFLKLMDLKHQHLISKIFIHNNILNIVTFHSVGYQDLNNDDTKNNIKVLIKIFTKRFLNTPFDKVNTIKIFSQRYREKQNFIQDEKKTSYVELSKAQFKNPFKNKKLYTQFEELRAKINDL
ncbi:hypothetical protein JG676_05870 [Campylobacter sp. 2018MI35]|uniref:hypothetical protein n=1 Tax=Campylobacter sp. 2018MI34 TaxID=2800582 RepID=UPI0019045D41|nr:hypothetical protein [Campylobacter sp. 2018MI34]MBK1992125.1 hypothetical protein [Campylobacter sp. 2018MI34]